MHSESDDLAVAVSGLLYIATPHHAARAHSGVRRARPDVEMTQCCTHTATAGRAKGEFRAHRACIAFWRPTQPASGAA